MDSQGADSAGESQGFDSVTTQRRRPGVLDLIFRFRFALHVVVYVLAFWAPWNTWLGNAALPLGSGNSTWLMLAGWLARNGWISFTAATVLLLVLGILFALAGAFLRTWGTAYLGAGVMQDSSLHGQWVLADGPFRYVRNPLYLGTVLHTVALALVMPVSGAVFGLIAIPLLQAALIAAEERFLAATRGEDYLAYKKRVPRILPSLRAKVAAAGATPHWGQAFAGEIYMWGVVAAFAAAGWRYNAHLITRAVVISLGVSLVVRGFIPKRR